MRGLAGLVIDVLLSDGCAEGRARKGATADVFRGEKGLPLGANRRALGAARTHLLATPPPRHLLSGPRPRDVGIGAQGCAHVTARGLAAGAQCQPGQGRRPWPAPPVSAPALEREFFSDNLLVRVHHIDWMSWLTGLAAWEFRIPFSV